MFQVTAQVDANGVCSLVMAADRATVRAMSAQVRKLRSQLKDDDEAEGHLRFLLLRLHELGKEGDIG